MTILPVSTTQVLDPHLRGNIAINGTSVMYSCVGSEKLALHEAVP